MRDEIDIAFRQIVAEYTGVAINIAFRMLRNHKDSERAVQEAFISAYRAFPKFKGQYKVST
jgi:DNA-directed RNA polymerase specialized sigma24 family protein